MRKFDRIVLKLCLQCETEFSSKETHNRKYCSHLCYGKSRKGLRVGFSAPGYKNDKAYMQTEAYKNSRRKLTTKAYRRFANAVHKLSSKVFEENKDILNPDNYIRGMNGVVGAYQLDHKISVKFGFENGWTIYQLSDLSNLQFIPWEQNIKKGSKVCL